MQSSEFALCHDRQACGSPALATDWQSDETDGGAVQLALQNDARSLQLVSGGGVAPESGEVCGGGGGGALQPPCVTVLSLSVHANDVPPTHDVSPHASVRRSPL